MEVNLTDLDKLEESTLSALPIRTPQEDHVATGVTTSTLVSPDKSNDHEDSDISDIFDHSAFKWMTRITYLILRIKFDAFIGEEYSCKLEFFKQLKYFGLDFPKVSLDLSLSSGRHLCIDSVRQCSDDTIAEDVVHKTRTVMVRTYKGKDLLKIKCTHVRT